ncbi:interleukin-1 receptor-associated kinase 1-like [Haliotis rubra]|uniref:interleukin-1 receptor-associated kinase 1-like n=1 Tax=Haliotis rubra TaxID=36100 RepID=UPI001EE51A91|nr:interleukin-1 receptor-associated kinase 1-like [Haliotis rubra]
MAQGKYLYEIPYGVTREIIMSMDADKSWEHLAGEIGYSFDKIKYFELEYQKYSGSPTKALLWDWGSRNATVKDLHNKLRVLNRVREMQILENYVATAKEPKLSNKPEKAFNSDFEEQHPSNRPVPSLSCINTDDLPKPPPPKPQVDDSNSNEINFNQLKVTATKSKVSSKIHVDVSEKEKQYDDKVIPGTKSTNSIPSGPSMFGKRVPQESASSTENKSSKASESTDSSSFDFSSIEKSDPMKGFESLKSYMKSDNLSFNDAAALVGTPFFEYKELFEATEGFSSSHKLGAGAFGTVYQGLLRCSRCAIKRLDEENKDVKGDKSEQFSELRALLRYRHENIVNLYGYAIDGPALCLVYQHMVKGSLEDRLQCKDNTPPLLWDKRIGIAAGAARGLQFLHRFGAKPLVHGDIKSANILLDKHFEAKIGDLGQAQYANSKTSSVLTGRFTHISQKQATSKIYGTKTYLAPELIRAGGRMSIKSDIYAFGVVLLELCSGEKANDERRESDTKFLTSYFSDLQDETKGDNSKLCRLFHDKRAGECPETFVIDLMSCAAKAVEGTKKARIDMEKLLHHLESIEDRWRETQSTMSESSCMSAHMSVTSGDNYSHPVLATNPGEMSHSLPTDPKKEEVSNKPTSPLEYFKQTSGKELPVPFKLAQYYDQHRNSLDDMQKCVSLPAQLPESLRLQMMADARKEGLSDHFDEIARIKAMNKQDQDGSLCDNFDSDPKKMEKLRQFDDELSGKNLSNYSVSSEIPESDPRKLAALKQFDKEKPMTRQPEESSEKVDNDYLPMADPAKLKKMDEFERQSSSDSKDSISSGLIFGEGGRPLPTMPPHLQEFDRVAPQEVSGNCLNHGSSEQRQMNVGQQCQVYCDQTENVSNHPYMHQMNLKFAQDRFGRLNIEEVQGGTCSSGSESDYFGNQSQPTMIPANLSRTGCVVSSANPLIQGSSRSGGIDSQNVQSVSGSPSPVLEVCETLSPMARQQRPYQYPVPYQQTETSTSQTYTSSRQMSKSLPGPHSVQ